MELELLSAAERRQLIAGWNETRREYGGAVTIHQMFAAQAARRGEAVAVVFGGEQSTYAELDRRSNQLAHHLVSLGVTPDTLVAVCLERSLELFVALLAITVTGIVVAITGFSLAGEASKEWKTKGWFVGTSMNVSNWAVALYAGLWAFDGWDNVGPYHVLGCFKKHPGIARFFSGTNI